MRYNHLKNTFPCEGFFSKPMLDIVEDFRMSRIGHIQDVFQRKICWTEAVTEVLRADLSTV